jgi:hypothetical protein
LRFRSIARGGAELFPVSTGTTGLGEGRHLARKTERIGTTVCKIGRVDGLQISVRVLDVARMKRRNPARNLLLRSAIDESCNLVVQVHAVFIVQVHHVPR